MTMIPQWTAISVVIYKQLKRIADSNGDPNSLDLLMKISDQDPTMNWYDIIHH